MGFQTWLSKANESDGTAAKEVAPPGDESTRSVSKSLSRTGGLIFKYKVFLDHKEQKQVNSKSSYQC